MRVAEICPNCATYTSADCIIYNGDYLSSIDVSPLDSLQEALEAINETFPATSGSGAPTAVPAFIGQQYIDTDTDELWLGLGTSSVNWGLVGEISTTTTTTTSA